MFSGPLAESVPTSITSFAHRGRPRADSTTSFTFYDEDEDQEDTNGTALDGAIDEEEFEEDFYDEGDADLESGGRRGSMRRESLRRVSTDNSGNSAEAPLLLRRMSTTSSRGSGHGKDGRTNQKVYLVTEDLTMVLAGFQTSSFGYMLYVSVCIATLGIGWLVFRWLPGWRVKLVGSTRALRDCQWVVIENQWGEMSIHDVVKQTYGRPLSSVFGQDEKSGMRTYDEDYDPIINSLRSIDYRYIRFCYNPLKDKFLMANTWKDPNWTHVRTVRSGLDTEETNYRAQVFGKNLIDLKEKTTMQLLVDEVFHPFYVFQIASLILWSVDEYYYYAACIAVISLVSITTTLVETKATMTRLREVSKFECDVRVLRNGFWRTVESGDLVPGDVYEVTDPSLSQIPCDSLLLSGDCILNESMLTGESVPVSKIPATDESLQMLSLGSATIHPDVARHILFCGTKIIRARRPHKDGSDDEAAALAMVVRTGFNTTKGALVRSMLFPKPSGFKFYRDSFRYISVMALIAGLGFVASFINFVRLGLEWHLIIVRALDLITIVVPPALPATLTIGTNFALSRLKAKKIFCISPQRVNVGGKLDVICFDKTGTLTEDGLDVLGVHVVQRGKCSELLSDANAILPRSSYERDPQIDYNINKIILYTMATCHSLRIIDDELVGDPLDVKMFEFTRWIFEEGEQQSADADESTNLTPPTARPPPGEEYDVDADPSNPNKTPTELGVLKQFEFVSQLRRASVVVRQFGASGGHIFVKGAPECMRDICRADSFPADYEDLLNYYTHRGFRVIGCAAKSIPKLSWLKVQKMSRHEAESNLEFVGFIIFENKLKPATTAVIEELGRANIRRVMCTGDNILTAISVGRECGLIDGMSHCFVPHFIEGDSRTALSKLAWRSVDNPNYELDENTLKPLPEDENLANPYEVSDLKNYSLAVSGDVFRWVVDFASERVLREMLVHGQVFARMSPDEKHELVEKLQSIDYSCGFCGDGANDCGALKAADVGISLSDAEASVAAPFTSRVFDISCVPEVIREGRAALVTSFSCFKYMSLYSAIQFTSVSFLYASASNLGDFQFLYIDLCLILPIAIFMGWAGPFQRLSTKRPTASLVSRKVLTPLLGQIVICVLIQLVAFKAVQKMPWYQPPVLDRDHSNSENSQNSALFLLSCYQYILSAIILSVGPPFRQPMTRNVPFLAAMFTTVFISSYILLDPAQWLYKMMELTMMSSGFKLFLLVLACIGFIIGYAGENWAFPELAKWIGKTKKTLFKQEKKRKEYKIILERSSA
jgi:cation-transporting ATPase 13A2